MNKEVNHKHKIKLKEAYTLSLIDIKITGFKCSQTHEWIAITNCVNPGKFLMLSVPSFLYLKIVIILDLL